MSNRIPPYHYYVQDGLSSFWQKFGTKSRKILFIFGVGFDPRCVPGLRIMGELFKEEAELHTCCIRFTNFFDEHLEENRKYTQECLNQIRNLINRMSDDSFKHTEIEVNMFSRSKQLIGEELLIDEFQDCFASKFDSYTDIILDISAFPRTLMYALLSYLWGLRKRGQNLFAVLTETPSVVTVDESDYVAPSFMFGQDNAIKEKSIIWIPVLGGRIERFENIHEFLKPDEIFPIIPFPSKDPKAGDHILLNSRVQLFEKWNVPLLNVMYASGDIPFDIFRKIKDIVDQQSPFFTKGSVVVSALSGRSLSLGVLLAALWSELAICHAQPITYKISNMDRDVIKSECENVDPTIYWLDGQLYEITDAAADSQTKNHTFHK